MLILFKESRIFTIMKKYTYFRILFIASILIFGACKDDVKDEDDVVDPKVQVMVDMYYDNQVLDFNTEYITEDGYRIKFSKVNFILTAFKNGEHQLFPAAVYKFEDDQHLVWKGEGDYSKFNQLNGTLGVIESENHKDPSARPLDDPLNIMNAGDMHWGWNPGYIFLAIEGRADTTQNQSGTFNHILTYHVGLNDFTRPLSFESIDWVKKSDLLHEFRFSIDLSVLFNGENKVDVKTERSSHTNPGEEELSARIIDNFVTGID